ncbi:peptidogalycan biosysnthesis protein [Pseudomonas aeruginosa]
MGRLPPPAQPFLRHAFLSALEDSHSVTPATGWPGSSRAARSARNGCARRCQPM